MPRRGSAAERVEHEPAMRANDRRTEDRRGGAATGGSGAGSGITLDRRAANDRRKAPRRRADLRTIAELAERIDAGRTRLEVIVDGTEGLRLVAVFACGCSAVEPVGAGKTTLRVEACATHAEPPIARERRRR